MLGYTGMFPPASVEGHMCDRMVQHIRQNHIAQWVDNSIDTAVSTTGRVRNDPWPVDVDSDDSDFDKNLKQMKSRPQP